MKKCHYFFNLSCHNLLKDRYLNKGINHLIFFPQFVVIHTIKGFSVVNEAEIDVFLEFPCFFYDPADVGNLISGSSAFSSMNIRKFMLHILLKPSLENFDHYFASMWDECNCAVVWTFFGTAFFWDWNENWLFPNRKRSTSRLYIVTLLI